MTKISPLDSPALRRQSKSYPAAWDGRVPRRVRLLENVNSAPPGRYRFLLAIGFKVRPLCRGVVGQVYDCVVGQEGNTAIITEEGLIRVRPNEFQVEEWH